MLCGAINSVRVREQGEGSAVVNDGASTSAETKGVASFQRPETMPLCLHAIRCRQCRAEQEQHSQKVEELCTEVRELRMRHEELVARCIERELLTPELTDATLQTAMKGASGVM
jgi:hypothetical protein